jgi:hypothetical protein
MCSITPNTGPLPLGLVPVTARSVAQTPAVLAFEGSQQTRVTGTIARCTVFVFSALPPLRGPWHLRSGQA